MKDPSLNTRSTRWTLRWKGWPAMATPTERFAGDVAMNLDRTYRMLWNEQNPLEPNLIISIQWIVQNNTRQNNLFLNTSVLVHEDILCLYMHVHFVIYTYARKIQYMFNHIYVCIYIYVLYMFYTKLECVHVTYTRIFIHRCRRGEHCMILWPLYLRWIFSISIGQVPCNFSPALGTESSHLVNKKCSKWKVDASRLKKTGVLLQAHIKMNTFNCNLQWKNCVSMLNFWLRLVYYPGNTQVLTMLL